MEPAVLGNHEGRDLRFVVAAPGIQPDGERSGSGALPQAPADPGGALGIAMRVPCGFIAGSLAAFRDK